ncbi:MAG: helix-turn-helix domain-containing protein [Oscillibacter sp.]|nr:helix-turn-helix domain-containing protein [Oscillibacter sp.]MEA4992591.1 helix-turn-helix domain-containing protein [Oscillibacter sp.]MEA5039628.1 helix-turn-helix domain-containing protein [Clostridiaceae bacterium]
MNYRHLCIEERSCIRKSYMDGLSYREIARFAWTEPKCNLAQCVPGPLRALSNHTGCAAAAPNGRTAARWYWTEERRFCVARLNSPLALSDGDISETSAGMHEAGK